MKELSDFREINFPSANPLVVGFDTTIGVEVVDQPMSEVDIRTDAKDETTIVNMGNFWGQFWSNTNKRKAREAESKTEIKDETYVPSSPVPKKKF
jgi:hypothetical protein